MLWTIFVVLLILWAPGLASGAVLNGYIHLLLLIAVAVVLIRIIRGRRILQVAILNTRQDVLR